MIRRRPRQVPRYNVKYRDDKSYPYLAVTMSEEYPRVMARTPDGRVILGPFNVDRDEAIGSFRKLAELDVDAACFGHGAPVLADGSAALRAAVAHQAFHLAP